MSESCTNHAGCAGGLLHVRSYWLVPQGPLGMLGLITPTPIIAGFPHLIPPFLLYPHAPCAYASGVHTTHCIYHNWVDPPVTSQNIRAYSVARAYGSNGALPAAATTIVGMVATKLPRWPPNLVPPLSHWYHGQVSFTLIPSIQSRFPRMAARLFFERDILATSGFGRCLPGP
ncbi:hypothetical protein BD779DRAFT_178239 [Infundibulicybe gibba]|nr:hypothetical protein BD779DRAFT_178239 [Infundibulicybe gibba]